MSRFYLPLALLLAAAAPSALHAQTVLEQTRDKVVLKWAPLSMFDYYNTVLVGAEIPFPDPRFSFQQEFGYGHSRMSLWYDEGEQVPDRHNFRSRSQLRFYLREWNSVRIFLAGEYLIRKSRTTQTSDIGVGCNTGGWNCDYYKETTYTTEKTANAVHIKFGFQTWLSNRVSFEVAGGYGLRSTRNRSLTQGVPAPRGSDAPWWEDSDSRSPLPSISAGIQLGIMLGKIRQAD